MTKFLQHVTGNWINTAAICRINRRNGPIDDYWATGMNGEVLGELIGFNPDHDLADYIPAGYPLKVAVVTVMRNYDDDERSPPTADDVVTEFHFVIAWRIEWYAASPVLAVRPTPDSLIAIPMDDNLWTLPGDSSGLTIEQVKEEALRIAVRSWNRDHPEPDADEAEDEPSVKAQHL